ncbi:CBF-domain-containing protein [Exidia glandulosa HHB12029]|uniref:CBF-domain-containing protein n=1 Tax=Exidia glandulosa HHB12029 TaxID=1314781 RepID=A0A165F8D7_EXIGL|nr:CBF-domain-containing protein [Exidia glandulosa HHB12029]
MYGGGDARTWGNGWSKVKPFWSASTPLTLFFLAVMKAGTKASIKTPVKRKRDIDTAQSQPSSSSKKAKSTGQLASVTELEATLLDPDAPSLNPLADLLVHARSSRATPAEIHAAIFALYRVFVSLVTRGLFAPGSTITSEVKTWLYARLDEYTAFLSSLLGHEEEALKEGALQILFSLLKHLSESVSAATNTPQVQPYVWRTIVQGILGTAGLDLREYLKYDDIRWLFLRDLTATMQRDDPAPTLPMATNALSILDIFDRVPSTAKELKFFLPAFGRAPSKAANAALAAEDEDLPAEPDEDDWRAFFDRPAPAEEKEEKFGRAGRLSTHARLHAPPAHRAQLVTAWLAVLPRIAASEAESVRALGILHVKLVPYLKKEEAVRTMDWIAGCVDYGGTTGLLALNTLFELMTTMNLDYPDLYVRLYAYLDRNILHLKHRARFFRILERMLSSTHLPATLVASFIKRLSRLSLSAPPAAVVSIIPMVYNLLKRHPTCMALIHRDSLGEQTDPYDPTERSPLRSNALESSLWELQSLTAHYHAPTSTLAKIFSEPFTKPAYAMEDFLDHSYTTMFDAETGGKRGLKMKVAPAVRDEGDTQDLVKELWVI